MALKSDRIESSTRTARVNVSVGVALLVLLLVIVFVGQNQKSVSIKFLGWNGHISLGLSLLIAAVAGGIIVTLFGSARILQLRHRAKKAGSSKRHDEGEPVVDLTGSPAGASSDVEAAPTRRS